jgi:BRCT domain type II-containing protein
MQQQRPRKPTDAEVQNCCSREDMQRQQQQTRNPEAIKSKDQTVKTARSTPDNHSTDGVVVALITTAQQIMLDLKTAHINLKAAYNLVM